MQSILGREMKEKYFDNFKGELLMFDQGFLFYYFL